MEVHRHLDEELDHLRDSVLRLGGEAETALRRAMESLVGRDSAAARAVLDQDDETDQLEVEVDRQCADINDLYNALFHDLIEMMARAHITATRDARLLFVAKQLERIGDYVTDICELNVYMTEAAIIKHKH